jgi:hypothetical protein
LGKPHSISIGAEEERLLDELQVILGVDRSKAVRLAIHLTHHVALKLRQVEPMGLLEFLRRWLTSGKTHEQVIREYYLERLAEIMDRWVDRVKQDEA